MSELPTSDAVDQIVQPIFRRGRANQVAEEALRFGFVNKVVPEAELKTHVEALIARISEFSGPVLEVTKRVISNSMGLPLKEAMKKSQDLYLNELMNLQDVQEGLRAVIEKRKPVWKNK